MCEHSAEGAAHDRLSRRAFLLAGGVAAMSGVLGPGRAGAATAGVPGGSVATRNAGHLHSSGSELQASMSAQLRQAATWGVDRVWWTEHGWQHAMMGFRQFVGFRAQPDVEGASRLWFHAEPPTGTPVGSGGGLVATGPSPLDEQGGALRVWAQGASPGPATQRFLLSCAPTLTGDRLRAPYRGWVGRTTFTVEVTPVALELGSWLELAVDLSDHPGPDGTLQTHRLVYRLSASAPVRTTEALGQLGVVTVPVAVGPRTTLVLDPVQDVAALWPELQAHDMSLFDLHFGATSVLGGLAEGLWESFRFSWVKPDRSLEIQSELMAAYAQAYPGVAQEAGSELSWLPGSPHVCRLGGDPRIQDAVRGDVADAYFPGAVQAIHDSGGVATWNHPYGSDHKPLASPAALATRRHTIFANMVRTGLYGADGLEVAYADRGGAGLRAHLDLYDTLLRNLLLPAAIGASDDHTAGDWGRVRNGFMTVSLGPDTGAESVLSAVRAGRTSFAHIGLAHDTVLDLELGSGAVMGQVSVAAARNRKVAVRADGLPPGSAVRVVQGLVDYAGSAAPDPSTRVLAVRPAADFAAGPVVLPFRIAGPGTYLRTEVVAQDGVTVVAGSGPVVALVGEPPAGVTVPAGRRAG